MICYVMELSKSFQKLPSDILNRVLDYDGTIKYRNGKYMNQILKNDIRYKIFNNIPKCEVTLIYKIYHSALNKFHCKILFSNWRHCMYISDHAESYDGTIPSKISYMFLDKVKQIHIGFCDNYEIYYRQ